MKAFELIIKFNPATVAEGWQFIVRLNGKDRMVWNGDPLPLPSTEPSTANAPAEKI
jgi:hypothetical protein